MAPCRTIGYACRMEFVEDRYSYAEQRRREGRRARSWWRKHVAWIKSHRWPARVVIIIAEVGAVYTLFVFGLLLGLALRFGFT